MKIRKYISKVKEWCVQFWLDHFVTYMTICQSNEHVYVGRKLWKAIMKAVPSEQHNDIQIWFKKYPCVNNGVSRYEYVMFANNDLSGYQTPNGEKPLTVPLQFNVFGHIGFQCVQPTPAEIVYQYNIKAGFHDRIMLRVKAITINGEHAFIITDKVIGKPKSMFDYPSGMTGEEVELGDMILQ